MKRVRHISLTRLGISVESEMSAAQLSHEMARHTGDELTPVSYFSGAPRAKARKRARELLHIVTEADQEAENAPVQQRAFKKAA